MVCTLGVLVPCAFIAGIAGRKPVPVAAPVLGRSSVAANEFGSLVRTQTDLWPGRPSITRFWRNSGGSLAVELAIGDLERPDVLVYWTAATNSTPGALPSDAQFLGGLSTGALLPIPPGVAFEAGRLVLYSLADQEVVVTSRRLALPKN